MSDHPIPEDWRQGDPSSLLLLDVAAGRTVEADRALTHSELKLAVRHGLIGLLAASPQDTLSLPATPIFARLQTRQDVMNGHLRRVLMRLHAGGVHAAVVKGPHLSRWAYEHPELRTFTDLDVLVRPQDLETALDLLSADEAVPFIPEKTPDADKRHIPFVDPSGVRFTLDLHWDLFSYHQLRGCANGAVESAWEQAKFDPGHALGPLWELPAETIVTFLTTHGLLDHRFRLILFRDLVEAARRGFDWNAFVDFTRRWALRTPAYLLFLIAARALGAPVSDAELNRLRPDYAQLHLVERALAGTDLVRFDGHRMHPLNLGIVLLHDRASVRARLVASAPLGFRNWQRAVEPAWHRQRSSDRSVTLLVATNQRRGAEVNGERLAEGLRGKGWDVDFVALFGGDTGPLVRAEPLSRSDSDGRLNFDVVARLRHRIRETRPGVIFANGGSTLRYAAAAVATLRHRPKIVYGSIGQPSYWLRGRWHVALQKLAYRWADHILAVSELTKKELIDTIRYDPDRIDVVHVGVPSAFLVEHPRRDTGTLRLLYMGAMSPEKDPLAALEIASRLPDAQLRFVGSGRESDRVSKAIRDRGLADRIKVVGAVVDVLPHLAWADLLVLTSRTEGFPGVVLEAAAAGVPTVGFGVGGVTEAVVDGETGLIVPAGSVDQFVAVLEESAADRSQIYDMAKKARVRVEDRFLVEHAVKRHSELLQLILRGTSSV